jgi:hypothetical protein
VVNLFVMMLTRLFSLIKSYLAYLKVILVLLSFLKPYLQSPLNLVKSFIVVSTNTFLDLIDLLYDHDIHFFDVALKLLPRQGRFGGFIKGMFISTRRHMKAYRESRGKML